MRHISLLIAAAAMVGFADGAFAHHNLDHANGGSFNGAAGGCILKEGGEQITVGEMMQTLRVRTSGATGNPKQIVDAYPDSGWGNVGGLIAEKCGDPS